MSRSKLHGKTILASPIGNISRTFRRSLISCFHSSSRTDRSLALVSSDLTMSSFRLRLRRCSFEASKCQFFSKRLLPILNMVAHSAVVLDHHGLHGFDQTTLDVAGLGRLYGRVDQTLATAHCVKKKFARRQSDQIRVFDKAFGKRRVVVFDEVGQCAVLEAERYSLAFDVLLTDARDHLGYVDFGAFGAGDHHRLEAVEFGQAFLGRCACFVTGLVQYFVHVIFECLTQRVAWRWHQFVIVRFFDYFVHFFFCLLDRLFYAFVGFGIGDCLCHNNTVMSQKKILLNFTRRSGVFFIGDIGALTN
ncbi:secretin receptor [Brachionus plicatilis]|uniref:Secretin receptor n=1 Tax=Brachionus plicatilis TaxID=10195 RepID=A0A3M7RIY9_BRAPC|nr:secretin receptor [Brachionus plicatilis]